jgi:hypothetical protein
MLQTDGDFAAANLKIYIISAVSVFINGVERWQMVS